MHYGPLYYIGYKVISFKVTRECICTLVRAHVRVRIISVYPLQKPRLQHWRSQLPNRLKYKFSLCVSFGLSPPQARSWAGIGHEQESLCGSADIHNWLFPMGLAFREHRVVIGRIGFRSENFRLRPLLGFRMINSQTLWSIRRLWNSCLFTRD